VTPEQKEKIISKYDNQILELVDYQEDYTRSDLQGVAMAIVMNIISEVEKLK
jgi:hypothetical protein